MSAMQPQHSDEVSLIGSLQYSSAAFHRDPAHCQQSALTETESKTKDGTSYFLYCSLYTHTHKLPSTIHKPTTNSPQNASVSFQRGVFECWGEPGSHNYCNLAKCLQPHPPFRIIVCVYTYFLFDTNKEMDSHWTSSLIESCLCDRSDTEKNRFLKLLIGVHGSK